MKIPFSILRSVGSCALISNPASLSLVRTASLTASVKFSLIWVVTADTPEPVILGAMAFTF
ncbi:hypothetical protein D1872_293570 [compost metagenome]